MAFSDFLTYFLLITFQCSGGAGGKRTSAREVAHHDIEKAREEEAVQVATALKK